MSALPFAAGVLIWFLGPARFRSMAIRGLRGREGVPCAGNAVGPVMGTTVINGTGVRGFFLVSFSVAGVPFLGGCKIDSYRSPRFCCFLLAFERFCYSF